MEKLLKLQINESQNELYEISLENIESWGRGIEKIIEESQKFNGITPEFRWENGLWVEFYFNQEKSLPDGLGERLGKRLGETQQSIIKLMQSNPKIAITALASELEISTTAIEKHIKKLKEQKIIQRIGGARGGYWEIIVDKEYK